VVESERPLTEVAALLGFSAPSGFSRWYHAQFGHSPKEGRAKGARGTRKVAAS
jgi:transcriptional regulator GlxA family with amidase domain